MNLKVIQCSHWSPLAGDRGLCKIKHFRGRPTHTECNRCVDYDGPNRGLGDVIDKITTKTGIKTFVKRRQIKRNQKEALKTAEKIHKKRDCGCHGRRVKLNDLVPFKLKRSQENTRIPDA